MIFSRLRYVAFSLLTLLILLTANLLFFGGQFFDIRILAIYAVVTLGQAGFDIVQRNKASMRDGWHHLTPSAMEWFALIGCVAMTGVFLYIFFFIGSSRADIASQMTMLKSLIAVFAIGAALIFYGSFASTIRWNEEQIEQHRPFRTPVVIRWADLTGLEMTWTQSVRMVSRSGAIITFSPYQNGVPSLGQRITDQLELAEAE